MLRVRVNSKTLWDAIARQNISQNELARRLGITSGYMSQLVCGTRCPSPRLRRNMLELLDSLTFDDLFIIDDYKDDGES
ncbi:helix-turn-helix domain-containing protein [Dehalococcoidales bacterium]|nr:helix-turn-helix domain-containing protein [Dehalococcoidales bacterium]